MLNRINYQFENTIWQHQGTAGGSWQFVSLPIEISKEIRTHFQWQEEGWGRMKVIAKIGDIEWNTSIWFDTKLNSYILC